MDLFNKRSEYIEEQLTVADLSGDPLEQFKDWYLSASEAIEKDPNAFVLSTVSKSLKPSSRVVLLKQFNENGFVFFTNYLSQKGLEIANNPSVSALFYWPQLNRQIRLQGQVSKIAKQASDTYFLSRPIDSQLSAIVSPQSQVIENKEVLTHRIREIKNKAQEKQRPEHWGGYSLSVKEYEFWQGSLSRLHDRFRYTQKNGDWIVEQLAP